MATLTADFVLADLMGQTDDLLSRAQRHDQDAFAELCRPHLTKLRRFALRIVRNASDSEDVVQEVLTKAFTHIRDFRGDTKSFATWLSRITYHESIMLLRKRRQLGLSLDEAFAAEPGQAPALPATNERSPEELLITDERHAILRRCLDRMQPIYRDLLLLHLGLELTHEQIARRLEMPLNTVKVRIFRAKQMLKTRMTAYLERPRAFTVKDENPVAVA